MPTVHCMSQMQTDISFETVQSSLIVVLLFGSWRNDSSCNRKVNHIITSTPVIQTGVIPTCRSPSPPAASLSHGPLDCPASLSNLANDRVIHYPFFTFWPGANPWAKVHQKGRRPGRLIDLPSCKILSPCVNPSPRYLLPKFCGQKKQTNSKRYRHVGITR